MVNRGSTAAAEEMEALDKNELMSMLKFGADRWERGWMLCMALFCMEWGWWSYGLPNIRTWT